MAALGVALLMHSKMTQDTPPPSSLAQYAMILIPIKFHPRTNLSLLTNVICTQAAAEDKVGVPVVAVNYDDRTSLQTTLETHEIHTVISALALHIIGVGQAQINLIRAADKSKPTQRFISSSWAVRPSTR